MNRITAAVVLLACWLVTGPTEAADKPLVVELWPGKVPDETGDLGPETVRLSPKLTKKEVEVTEPTRLVTNVSKPTLTIYRPAKEKDTGAAVLICPGGGYWNLFWELEGEEVAAWLNAQGVTGIILKYRVPRRPDEPKGVPARRPLQDAQRAVSLVRGKAKEWGLDPKRIGVVGFSAGGHLALATATSFEKRTYEPIDDVDKISCRPDFAIAAYSGYLKDKDKDELAAGLSIPAGTPPIFLVHGGADIISPPEGSVIFYLALKRAGIPAELHIYAGAAHDFGVRKVDHPCATWTDRCVEWLARQGFLKPEEPRRPEGPAEGPAPEIKQEVKLLVSTPNEPIAKEVSLARAAAYLDYQSRAWTRINQCGTCHTNYPYLVARGQLGGDLTAFKEVRGFFEARIARWDSGKEDDRPGNDTEVVATASTLALQDALTVGKLHPLTRKALDRMWTLQKPSGAFDWLKCDWPPMEHDDYYGVVYAAVAVGHAPDNYADTEKARKGLDGFRRYFKANPPPSLHHKAMLLWASQKVPDLLSEKLQASTIQELRALQKADGGWSLPSLGDWVGQRPNDRNAPSDGYATGLVIYVLRQAGVPAKDEALQKGAAWLKSNQRESGAWFTKSLNSDRSHYITHAGTAYAVLALKACE